MKEIILPFNSQEYLYILFPDILHQSAEISIQFIDSNMQLLLLEDYIYTNIDEFITTLKQSLQGLLPLPLSMRQNIGFLWNEYLHKGSNGEQRAEWPAHKQHLWSPPGNIKPQITTWFYNNGQNKIIFEITPTYYWHYLDPQEYPDDEYITYEQFIKTYKPYVIKTLSTTLVQQWLEILSPLPAQIAEFTAIWNHEHSNCDCPERKEMEEEREREKQALEKKNQEYQ